VSVFLETNHLFLVNPKGGVEDVAAMKAAGFGAIFCNVLDFAPSDWDLIRDRAADLGVVCGPWARMIDAGFNYDPSKLDMLMEVARSWYQPYIINVEKELDYSGGDITNDIAEKVDGDDVAFSVEAWPFSTVDWNPLAKYPFLPQIFPQEVEAAKDPYACRWAWWNAGVRCVVFTFGTYWNQPPSTYDRLSPYGLYTADNVGNDFQAWASLGVHQPCQDLPTEPPPPPDQGGGWKVAPINDTEAREAITYAARASIQNYEDDKPKGRVTVCKRIAQLDNTDPKWNSCRDKVVKALDDAGVPK
jgi:hypothetical protein